MSESSQIVFQAPEIDRLAPLFPAYQIECLIATGGMGAVYRAVQKSLDRTVAIKILPREFSQDPVFCAGFEAEAKSMARLNHPNLIGVYDFGEVDGMLFIIMEFVPGQSLFHYAHGHAVDSNEAIRLITGISQGLAHAHENGIIHRDIKPSNILLDHNGEPKIGDFGLAHPIGTGHQEGTEIYGTPDYTAPEVLSSPKAVNHRADIFSVGVMLHELLTGVLPSNDSRPASVIVRCDPRFDAIIRHATEPIPELRYANVHEMIADISSIMQPRGFSAVPTQVMRPRSPSAVLPGSAKKPEGSSMFSRLLFLLLILALGFIAYKRYNGEPIFTKRIVVKAPTHARPNAAVDPADSDETKPTLAPGTETPAPETPAPETPAPETPAPETPAPETPAPETPAPETPAPETSAPETSEAQAGSESQARFDVPAFLAKAKVFMQRKGQVEIDFYHRDLLKNFEELEDKLKRAARRVSEQESRAEAEKNLASFIENCKKDHGRIPQTLADHLSYLEDASRDHARYLQKQSAMDTKMIEKLEPLRKLYIDGLQKQHATLLKDNDAAAARQIAEEIEMTRSNKGHFQELMGCNIAQAEEPTE
jgi:serine/threonine protein kinase